MSNGAACHDAAVDALCRAVEQGPLDAEEEQYLVDLASLDAGRAVLKR
jgi:hypothetical protein